MPSTDPVERDLSKETFQDDSTEPRVEFQHKSPETTVHELQDADRRMPGAWPFEGKAKSTPPLGRYPDYRAIETVLSPVYMMVESGLGALRQGAFPALERFQKRVESTYDTEVVWWPLPNPRRDMICPPGYDKILCKCVRYPALTTQP